MRPVIKFCLATTVVLVLVLGLTGMAFAQTVKVTEDAETFTLSNDVITAVVSKRSGDLVGMSYKGFETLSHDSGGHSAFYWSHDVTGAKALRTQITIDPAKNGGERAEVSIKGFSGGTVKMGHGPGTPKDGDVYADVEIRYSLGKDDAGVYTWCIFDHPAEYPGSTMSEARIASKLVKDFTHIYVDAERSGKYPLLNEGIDKYAYTTLQAEERAFGWTSPEKKRGWFLLNPSAEYLSGGPTKVEFLGHGTHPTVLNYWKSSHYLGANLTFIQGEAYSRVVGPFLLYVNEGASHEAMVADAKAQLKKEEAKWPYGWAKSPAYANAEQRGSVTGRLRLNDPYQKAYPGTLTVGLSRAPYEINAPRSDNMPQGVKTKRTLIWQNDAKYLQFWKAETSPDGHFTVPNVVPGTYTFYAYAEGVLGEFAQANVTVEAGKTLKLDDLVWTPVRKGKPVWEVGVANRSAKEFAGGRRYFDIGTQQIYAKAFPNDVTYRIGKSKPETDWFFAHQPHIDGEAVVKPFVGMAGNGRATPYNIDFVMKGTASGKATLRVAVSATNPGPVEVTVNGQAAGPIKLGPPDGALTRHQMYGRWYETDLVFDAALLKAGENRLTLTVPAGPLNNGVVYDYLRLEVE